MHFFPKMTIHLQTQVIIVVCSAFVFSASSWDLTSLQFVHIIYRHGEKNPALTYPLDPYKNESFWPGGFSQINDKGKKSMYDLGLYLRQRYDGYVNTNYTDAEVVAVSSDTDRCIISAMSCLAGLYKQENLKATWNPDIKWEPIPVHVLMKEHDRFIHLTENCPYLDEQLRKIFADDGLSAQFNKENNELNEYIANHSGLSPPGLFSTALAFVILEAEKTTQDINPLPEWTNALLDSKGFTGLYATILKSLNEDEKWKRLRTGPIYAEMVEHMENKLDNSSDFDTKMWIYSGHDRSIVDMIMGLGIDFDGEICPYASALILELHQDPTSLEFYIEMLYRNDTASDTPHILRIPNCENPCSFETFKQIVSKLQYANWTKECEISNTQTTVAPPALKLNRKDSAAHTAGFFICLLFSVFAVILAYDRKKKMKRQDYFTL